MEWCCAKCGLTATADDWSLLLSMGWRVVANGEMRCVICVKKDPARLVAYGRELRAEAVTGLRSRRELR